MKNKQINFLVTLQIPINLEQERNRIAKINKSKYPYTKKETAKLLKLVDLIENGEIKKAVLFYNKFNHDEKEFSCAEITDLFDVIFINKYPVVSVKKEELNKDRLE